MASKAAETTAVGTETLAFCTSCKMDLAHIIAAMKGDKIAKVECKTCKKTHVYKAPKGVTEPPKKRTRKSPKESAEEETRSLEAEWQKLMDSQKDIPIKPYGMKKNFGLGDKLAHPNFGDGVITRIIYPNKIEVLFRTYMKVLIHGGVTDSLHVRA